MPPPARTSACRGGLSQPGRIGIRRDLGCRPPGLERRPRRRCVIRRRARLLVRCPSPAMYDTDENPVRTAVLVAVQRPDVEDDEFAESLAELRRLAKTL